MMSGRFKEVSPLEGEELSAGPRGFCDGRAAVLDKIDRMEHQIGSISENIISDTWLCFVKRSDRFWDGVSPCR